MKMKRFAAVFAALIAAAVLSCDTIFNDLYNETTRETVFIGGTFTTIGGFDQQRIGAVEGTAGALVNWPVNLDPLPGEARAIVVYGDRVCIGTSAGLFIADRKSGAVVAVIDTTAPIYSLAVADGILYMGGLFPSFNGLTRNSAAALDLSTLQVTGWNPDCTYDGAAGSGQIYAIAVLGDTVYLGGYFNRLGAQTRNMAAAVDRTYGMLKPWNPNSDATIRAINVTDDCVYLGGDFNNVNGQPRTYIAAVNPVTGVLTSWDPVVVGGVVRALVLYGDTLYIGGDFTVCGGYSRSRLAAVDRNTGQTLSWSPSANSVVYSIAVYGGQVYIGGVFTAIAGQARNYATAVDMDLGRVTSWNPDLSGQVNSLVIAR